MKVCIILGTRPEIIKLSSTIKECEKRNINYFVIHSNQHYSTNMDKIFFEELRLPEPKYNLHIGSGTHGNQTGKILIKTEKILSDEKPDIVLIQGDTNTVLAGALAATKLNIKVGHIEAGLRSYNRKMPEETNRIVTDHTSDYLFAPTRIQEEILINEGIDKKKIFVVGNTISDAIKQNITQAENKSKIMDKLNLSKKGYFLVTAHRALNVDIKENLMNLLSIIKAVVDKYDERLIYPMHPRTKKMIDQNNLHNYLGGIEVIEPVSYFDFLVLEKNTKLILTDSGGIQEEACIMQIPCITLREDTERQETVEAGVNIITGLNKTRVLKSIEKMLEKKINWKNPYGKGDTGKKIIDTISNELF